MAGAFRSLRTRGVAIARSIITVSTPSAPQYEVSSRVAVAAAVCGGQSSLSSPSLSSFSSLYGRLSSPISTRMASITAAPGDEFVPPAEILATSLHTAKWKSDPNTKSPMERIWEVPPVEWDGDIAECDGGVDPALGHPVEFIRLYPNQESVCKYCGLRYVISPHAHH